jgi:hypothetical protein
MIEQSIKIIINIPWFEGTESQKWDRTLCKDYLHQIGDRLRGIISFPHPPNGSGQDDLFYISSSAARISCRISSKGAATLTTGNAGDAKSAEIITALLNFYKCPCASPFPGNGTRAANSSCAIPVSGK